MGTRRPLHIESLEDRRLLATVTVNTTSDVLDLDADVSSIASLIATPGADGQISLREAILAANNTPNAGAPDEIHFAIPAFDDGHVYYQNNGTEGISLDHVMSTSAVNDADIADMDPDWPHSWYRIQPTVALPAITEPVILNGYTQSGTSRNSGGPLEGLDTVLRIELDGSQAGSTPGLTIRSGNSTVKGLVINRFQQESILVTSPGVSIPETPPEGVVSWWPGEEDGEDILGGNHGTVEPGVVVSGAFEFDGRSSAGGGVDLGNVPAFDFTQSSSFTIEAWVNRTSTGSIVNLNYDCNSDGIYTAQMLGVSSNEKVFFQVRDANGVTAGPVWGPTLEESVWYHVVAVREATDTETLLRLYVDGVEVATAVDPTTGPLSRNCPDLIGRRNWCGDTSVFTGLIDEVRVFDRALSASEILAAYSAATLPEDADNRIQGNFIGTDVSGTQALGHLNGGPGIRLALAANGNIVGTDGDGTETDHRGERNLISGHYHASGVEVGSDHNVLAGNFIGTDATGTKGLGNFHGININGRHNLIGTNADGEADDAERNIISGNFTPNYDFGMDIQIVGGSRNVVAGNFLGTDVTGTQPMDQKSVLGMVLLGGTSAYNRIGTDGDGTRDDIERNVISGHTYCGVGIGLGVFEHNLVAGNFIGTDVSGTLPLGNELLGIGILANTGSNQIGGTETLGNTIAFNGGPGIWMVADGNYPTTGNKIQGNSIHSNNCAGATVTLGIDLGGTWTASDIFGRGLQWDGLTDAGNDTNDADEGPNNLQNFPVITLAQAGATTRVAGELHSEASKYYVLDFYANSVPDPSGYGEGERYLGLVTVKTDELGNAAFDVVLSGESFLGEAITATATEKVMVPDSDPVEFVLHGLTDQPTGSTSEFAHNVDATDMVSGQLQEYVDTLNGTVLTLNHINESNLDALVDEIAALVGGDPANPITIDVWLQPGTYTEELIITVPAVFEVELNGYMGPVIFQGSSPALTLRSGQLRILGGSSVDVHLPGGVTFTNTTDAPSILVEGGNLYLRKCVVEETTGGDRAAIEILGGIVDLGTTDDPGENTIIVNGDGQFVQYASSATVYDVGNTLDIAPDFDAGPDETLVLAQTAILSRQISFADPDSDSWNGTVSFGDGPTHEQLVIDQVSKSFTLDHTYTEPGTFTVTVTVDDNEGGSHTDGFQVMVLVNQPPQMQDQSFQSEENGSVVGTLLATDPDLPEDTLTYAISGGPDRDLFAIDPATGDLSFVAAPDFESPSDADENNLYELQVTVTDGCEATDTASVTVSVLNLASITGTVFVDVNANGLYEANELGIDEVTIELLDAVTGNPILDEYGVPVAAITDHGGYYQLEDLQPGSYLVHEIQPSGVDDGPEILGSRDDSTIAADDTFQLTLEHTDAVDYIFAEIGQQVSSGDTASIGFWQNKHGQALIQQGGTPLANWLTSNFSNVFGDVFTGEQATGAAVADFYRDELFRQKARNGTGPAKVDCQFMAVALATYFTSLNWAGDVATAYGFNVTDTGIKTKVVNVGSNGAAFDVADDTDLTIMQLLLATDGLTDLDEDTSGFAYIYDQNGDGEIDSLEASLRVMANDVYTMINEQGN